MIASLRQSSAGPCQDSGPSKHFSSLCFQNLILHSTQSLGIWGSVKLNSSVLDMCFEKPYRLSAHILCFLNSITLKSHWAIIFIKGKLETRKAYIFAVFTGKRNALTPDLFSHCKRVLPMTRCKHFFFLKIIQSQDTKCASFLPKPKSIFNHKVHVLKTLKLQDTHFTYCL